MYLHPRGALVARTKKTALLAVWGTAKASASLLSLGKFRVPEAGRDVKGNALHAGHPSAMLAPWASPIKEVAPMWQFLTDVATQVVAGVVVALILRHLMK